MAEKENLLPETNIFSEMMKYFQESTAQFLSKMTQDDKYVKALSRFRDSLLDVKSYSDKIVAQTMKNMNLPTKEEVERALYKMTMLEAKMNDISDKIDQLLKKKKSDA
ncbi:MAG TPA: hypothetical protein DHW82_04295 [Spirochaetia bacterium]|nr:MAG: hypothetical protein A2Y41_02115 [Spirochaetes bacterium GWB1_36_13]HCL56214.1 hypothetical protein [Spirochaetia bacterium]